jgi:uncharacterized protein (TIGR03067 family)
MHFPVPVFPCLRFTKKAGGPANPLNGTWIPVRQEMNGRELPASYFEKQQLILQDSLYMVIAENTDKGIVRIHGNKIDIFGKEGPNAGKQFKAIFSRKGDELTVCHNLKGDAYPESLNTLDKTGIFSPYSRKESMNEAMAA